MSCDAGVIDRDIEGAAPRAVFIDVDGTLCDSRQRVPGSAVCALARVRERGHRLFLCTGRSVPEVYPRFFDLGFEGIVGGAGGYAAVGDTVLLDERMPAEHVRVLTALWEDLGAFYVWQGPDQMGLSRGYLEFFVPRAGLNPEDWVEYAQSVTPFVVGVEGGSFTKVTAYVPPENASMERVVRRCPTAIAPSSDRWGQQGMFPSRFSRIACPRRWVWRPCVSTSASPCHVLWLLATLTMMSRP